MTVLKTRVAPEFKVIFNNLAKAKGLTESQFLREVSEAAVANMAAGAGVEQGLGIAAGAVVELVPDNAATAQVTVRMAQFLLDGVKARAEAHEMSVSRWIAALVQSNLTNYPVVKDSDGLALEANERQLAALGRNLNQIAKSMNFANSVQPGSFTKEWMPMNRLNHVEAAIESTRLVIRALVRTSGDVWRIE